jgi:alkylation response protein AidB-like acyl-CoA dehydrogenase
VNYEFSDEERLLHEACISLFERHAGPDRARHLTEQGGCDRPLLTALAEAGMLNLALDPDIGPIGAQFVTEWAAEAAAVAPIGWRTLVAPQVLGTDVPPVVTVAHARSGALVRFGMDADVILLIDDGVAYLANPDDWSATPASTRYGFPLARVDIVGGTPLGEDAAKTIQRWSQIALASEIAGAGRSAIALTVQYVKDRKQFGRALGSYQAIQHKLAEDLMSIEASSWLAREAAFHDAPAEAAAVAATFAINCAHRIMSDMHQFTGAIGFAKEYNLYLWSTRLEYLALESGGIQAHADALFDSRWLRDAV